MKCASDGSHLGVDSVFIYRLHPVAGIQIQEAASDQSPENKSVLVKETYLSDLEVSTLADGLAVVGGILLGVPVPFVVNIGTVCQVLVLVHLGGIPVVVEVLVHFVVEVDPSILSLQPRPGLVSLSVLLEVVQKVLIVFVLGQFLPEFEIHLLI